MQTILLTVDSLRADHLGQYGYDRETMPALDDIQNAGATFENAFANAPYTRISIPSFHTSRYLAYQDLEAVPTVASLLSQAGYRTGVIGTQSAIDIGSYGFDETIDLDDEMDNVADEEYHERTLEERSLPERASYHINEIATAVSQFVQRHDYDIAYELLRRPYNAVFGGSGFHYQGYTSAEAVTDRAVSWLESNADSSFFLWLHYMDPHRPYGIHEDDPHYLPEPIPEERIRGLMKRAGTAPDDVSDDERRLLCDLYDSDLRYCSRHLSRLFDGLRELGLWEELNLIFTADHGEEFGEHGRFFHRNYPYDELMHVPLFSKAPSMYDPKTVVSDGRELLDIAPTICKLFDVDPEDAEFQGRPLDVGDDRQVIALGQPHETPPATTVRERTWKYIESEKRQQLYNLQNDPDEGDDVALTNLKEVNRLKSTVPDYLQERDIERPRDPTDDVDRERLEALGYLEMNQDE